MSELKEISYKEANALLFINWELKNTHTFLGNIGACWPTTKLRAMMRKSKLYFSPEEFVFGGHQIVMETPEGKVYRLETEHDKVRKYLRKAQP